MKTFVGNYLGPKERLSTFLGQLGLKSGLGLTVTVVVPKEGMYQVQFEGYLILNGTLISQFASSNGHIPVGSVVLHLKQADILVSRNTVFAYEL